MGKIKFMVWPECYGKYLVTPHGSIFSTDFNHTGKTKELRQYCDEDGYSYVVLIYHGRRLKRVVHRMVAKMFLADKPTIKHQVNHKNGNRTDNRVENLEWVTSRENTLHGWRVNGRKVSEKQRIASSKAMRKANHVRWHGKAA